MKKVLRVAVLVLCGLTGFLLTAHGIGEVVLIHTPGSEDILRHLIAGGTSIAGGVCVVAVSISQLECLRTHRKSGDRL